MNGDPCLFVLAMILFRNQWIRSELPKLFKKAVSSLLYLCKQQYFKEASENVSCSYVNIEGQQLDSNACRNVLLRLLSIVPDGIIDFFAPIANAMQASFLELDCIPTEAGRFSKPANVLLPTVNNSATDLSDVWIAYTQRLLELSNRALVYRSIQLSPNTVRLLAIPQLCVSELTKLITAAAQKVIRDHGN